MLHDEFEIGPRSNGGRAQPLRALRAPAAWYIPPHPFPESRLFGRTTLDNGLRVVTTTMPTARSVSTAFFVGVGARHEPEPIQGISHFVEHMLFKGTRSRPTAQDV